MHRSAERMRKGKWKHIYDYSSYKQSKLRRKQCLLIGLFGSLVIFITIVTGRFEKDLKIFADANNILFFWQKQDPTADDVYFSQDTICYDLYTAPINAMGIYIPNHKINQCQEYINMAKGTKINSFVINVKDDTGNLTFNTDNQALIDMGVVLADPPIDDIEQLMRRLYEANIYPIARVVAFKDNKVAKKDSTRAVKQKDGTTYVTSGGDTWLDPYNKENWEYLLEVCKEAHRKGFKEIQFDYVRFHESMNENRVILDDEKSKTDIITEFTKYICENLHEEGVKVSADVFGAVVLSDLDASIVGQDFTAMSQYLDYISPMVYPSHYAEGTFGIEYPHLNPYEMILKTMNLGQKRMNAEEVKPKAKIRPWLQDFTMKNIKPYLAYGPEQIKEQIQGANDAGVEEWLLWNAGGYYTTEALMTE